MATTYTNSFEISKNDEINAGNIQTNEGEESEEFINAEILSFNHNVLNYFEGSSELEVQRHFEKAFFSSMAGKQQIEPPSKPMRERKLPASFWHQDHLTSSSQVYPMTSLNTACQYPNGLQIIYTTPTVIGQSLATHRYTDAMDFHSPVTSRLISYAKLPISALAASAQNVTLTHAQINDRPRCSLVDATAAQYAYGPRAGHGFNPRYNFMLVQPDVKPELPLVCGQQRGYGNKRG